jgi:hypothetical protein
VFDAVAAAWLSGDLPGRRRRREPGAAVGFGIDSVLLSELVFPIITGAFGQVLATSITSRTKAMRIGRRPGRQSAPDAVAAAGEGAAVATGETVVAIETSVRTTGVTVGDRDGERVAHRVAFTAGQLRTIHDICLQDAATLGLPPAKARLLADAVVGALSVAPSAVGPRPRPRP